LPNGGGGGGGRVAVSAPSNSFAGIISAYGGAGRVPGGAGFVYSEGAQTSTPKLLFDNDGLVGALTPVSAGAPTGVDLTLADGAIVEAEDNWLIANLTVGSNGTLYLFPDQTVLTVSGNAQVQPTGIITATGGGWDADSGPGAGVASANHTGSGGGYGGAGGDSQGGAPGGLTNGTPEIPTASGSGGGVSFGQVVGVSQGGGAIDLNVNGALTVDGAISADGNNATYPGAGGGSGGSVWLTAGTLDGNGLISANGGAGQGNLGGGGGGGRIAIYSPVNNFAGQITVAGGGGFAPGGDGSIYVSTNQTAAKVSAASIPVLAIAPGSGAQVKLAWPSDYGVSYQVQSSTDLIHWEPFGGAISGNAGGASVTLTPTPGGQQQYYRVVSVN
jgi:hypothetical protein